MLDDRGDPAFKDEYGIREAYDEAEGIAVHGDTTGLVWIASQISGTCWTM